MKQQTIFKETEIGMIPEGWEARLIGDLVQINENTINKNYKEKEIEYIDTASVIKGALIKTQKIFLDEAPSRAKRIIKSHDILISTVRPNLKHFFFIKQTKNNLVGSTGFAVISAKKAHPKFLYYYLTSNKYTDFLTSIADTHTSTYPSFNPDVIENSFCPYPNYTEQKSIAKILSDLDEKIEVDRKMNEILEELGRMLFKRWFVDFEFPDEKGKPYKSSGGRMVESELGEIPINWKVEKLKNFCDSYSGCSYSSKELTGSRNALVTLKSISRKGEFQKEGFKEYSGKYKETQVVNDGDIVVAHTDLTQNVEVLGTPAIVRDYRLYDKMIVSLDLVIAKPKKEYHRLFLFHILKTNKFHNHAIGYSNGTTVIHLNKKAIPEYEFILPEDNLLKTFNAKIEPLFKSIKKNILEIEPLRKTRELLLPKLMTGKIRVKL